MRTDRVLLRRWHEQDREPFAALNADPVVMRYFTAPLSREQSDALVDRIEAHFDEHGYGLWALEVDQQFIGFTGLQWTTLDLPDDPSLEVGWRLAKRWWGQGFASEAARAAVAVGLEAAGRLVSVTALTNLPSQAVMERIGLRRDALFDHPRVPVGDPLRPHVLYRTP